MPENLRGKHVLVVEDEFLIATLIADALADAGCIVLGPVAHVADALALLRCGEVEIAVLDVNLGAETSFPVIDRLTENRMPFILVTGYAPNSLPRRYAGCPLLSKPFQLSDLLSAVSRLSSSADGTGRRPDARSPKEQSPGEDTA